MPNRRTLTILWVGTMLAAGFFCFQISINGATNQFVTVLSRSEVVPPNQAIVELREEEVLAVKVEPVHDAKPPSEPAASIAAVKQPPAAHQNSEPESTKAPSEMQNTPTTVSKAPLANEDAVAKQKMPAVPKTEPFTRKVILPDIEAKIQKKKALQRSDMFQKIYSGNLWSSSESRSGFGSELAHSAQARKMIEFVIEEFKIRSWVDAPCGDFNWQHHVSNFAQINYTGLDVVPQAILDNSRRHMADLPNARFANVDLVTSRDLPYADLYLVRDLIQHLPLEDGMQVFRNVATSGAKYLLTNMHVRKSDGEPLPNKAVEPGNYYPNHPMLEPFNFPEPLMYIRDIDDYSFGRTPPSREIKIMGLWKLDSAGLMGQGTGAGFKIDLAEARDIVERRESLSSLL